MNSSSDINSHVALGDSMQLSYPGDCISVPKAGKNGEPLEEFMQNSHHDDTKMAYNHGIHLRSSLPCQIDASSWHKTLARDAQDPPRPRQLIVVPSPTTPCGIINNCCKF